jgi:DNA-directed RNA polymerase subunit RPC12/RpoP
MNPIVSSDTFDAFFAWAPWVVGIAIYLVFYFAKRREIATSMAAAQAHATASQPQAAQSFACSQCGRRGPREQMVAQDHGGAVGYKCTNCAQEALV